LLLACARLSLADLFQLEFLVADLLFELSKQRLSVVSIRIYAFELSHLVLARVDPNVELVYFQT